MSSTHGPAPEDDPAKRPTMELDTLLDVLETQAGGIQRAVQSVKEEAEPGEELALGQVESVRTEVIEFQAAVENLLTEHCTEATPWEHAGEHVPAPRLEAFAGGA